LESVERMKGLLAKPVSRYVASIIDGAIVMGIVIGLNYFGSYKGYDVESLNSFVIFSFIVKLLTYLFIDVAIPYLYDGKTIGRTVMGITLYQENGKKVDIFLLLKRSSIFILIAIVSDILFLSNISFALWAVVFMVSIYLIYTDTLRQTVHDKLAKSVMLDDKKLIEDKNKGK